MWRSSTPPDTSDQVVFPDQEDSIWQLDEKTGEYYLHHFYRHQPDLNVANPQVRDEIARTMGFWLQLGLSGFRVDAVPFLFADGDLPADEQEFHFDPHEYLRHLRSYLSRRVGDGVLLGEVNVPHAEQKKFFGGSDGDELSMQFDFLGMQAFYLSMARQDARPLAKALRARPRIDPDNQWANFVRNHDELTLDKLSDAERQEVFDAFGPEPDLQLFDRGLRRRLPPMLHGDPRRLRLAYSLMFATPGTLVLFYGEEIGMGENLDIEGRMSVRSPMQWSRREHGGFSTAPARKLARPVTSGAYGPDRVNVSDQRLDPDSLYSFMRLLISRYRQSPELGWATFREIRQPVHSVLAQVAQAGEWAMLTVHQLGDEAVTVTLDLREALPDLAEGTELVDVLGGTRVQVGDGHVELPLDGYGFAWLRVCPPGDRRIV